jgi:hypothetical protein
MSEYSLFCRLDDLEREFGMAKATIIRLTNAVDNLNSRLEIVEERLKYTLTCELEKDNHPEEK